MAQSTTRAENGAISSSQLSLSIEAFLSASVMESQSSCR